jgi:hypothetical protein
MRKICRFLVIASDSTGARCCPDAIDARRHNRSAALSCKVAVTIASAYWTGARDCVGDVPMTRRAELRAARQGRGAEPRSGLCLCTCMAF